MQSLDRSEYWALLGGKLCSSVFAIVAGGAGNVGTWEIANVPQGEKDQIYIVERLILSTAIRVRWSATSGTTAPFGSPGVITLRDQRMNETGSGAGSSSAQVSTGNLADFVLVGGAMTGPAIIPLDYILPPGGKFFCAGPPNTAFEVTVEWRERTTARTEMSLR